MATVGAATLFAQMALAEGVVIKSTTDAYPRGTVIEAGEDLQLKGDDVLSVLDRSGRTFEITESQPYRLNESTSPVRRINAVDAMTWDEERSRIGGTRTQEYEECVASASDRTDLTPEDCTRLHLAKTPLPELSLSATGFRSVIAPREKLRVSLQANFEAIVTCRIHGDSGDDRQRPLLPIGPRGQTTKQVPSGTKISIPNRGGSPLLAPAEPGTYKMSCHAIDAMSVSDIRTTDDELSISADCCAAEKSWAILHGRPVATATVKLHVQSDG